MRDVTIPRPLLGLFVVTRVLLGVGIGLLISNQMNRERRRRLGRTLVAIGGASTFPAVAMIASKSRKMLHA